MMASFPENITPVLYSIVKIIANYDNVEWNSYMSAIPKQNHLLSLFGLKQKKRVQEEIGVSIHSDFFQKSRRILDIGAGFGKYGLLLRECFLSLQSALGDFTPRDIISIDGLDSSPYFIDWYKDKNIYHKFYDCDLFELSFQELSKYDLILLIDVVEHHEKERIFDWYSKNKLMNKLFISSPIQTVMYTERHYDSNPHITQWNMEDFRRMNVKLQDFSTYYSWIVRV
jgi:2-polyprenyl-3-methyl-5-hydroxy-6-metoxy-1,4-benzoquinol methylase